MKKPEKLYENSIHQKQESVEWIIGPENSCHNE
jgi:hypothetical protein